MICEILLNRFSRDLVKDSPPAYNTPEFAESRDLGRTKLVRVYL